MSAPLPQPVETALSRPYWEGLRAGVLSIQQCGGCGHYWLPASEACPRCLSPDKQWVPSAGRGTIASWVRYHVAYADAFRDRLPYVVALVALDEGPRLISNIVAPGDAAPALGQPVTLRLESRGEFVLPLFEIAPDPFTSNRPESPT